VVDASALVEYLLRTPRARPVATIVEDAEIDLHVPALCDVEVAAAFRRALLGGAMGAGRTAEAVGDYLDLPLTRHGHESLLVRVLELRENVSAYDATCVALAERLEAALLTADRALARAVRGVGVVRVLP